MLCLDFVNLESVITMFLQYLAMASSMRDWAKGLFELITACHSLWVGFLLFSVLISAICSSRLGVFSVVRISSVISVSSVISYSLSESVCVYFPILVLSVSGVMLGRDLRLFRCPTVCQSCGVSVSVSCPVVRD